jgi:tetratricopeptide (TPR) repeat protein
MEDLHEAQLDTDSSHLFLGLAYAKLERFEDAVLEFGQVTKTWKWREEVIYCNTYGYALVRIGDFSGAREHIEQNIRSSWPTEYREWALRLLATLPETCGFPVLPEARPRLLH